MKQPSQPPVGEQELALLRHVAQRGPSSVAQVVESFGGEHGLARSTVLTMMERLRAKGYLSRRRSEGLYLYASRQEHSELLRGLVTQFVERSLEGSLSPFLSYLTQSDQVTDEERAQLEALVSRLDSKRRESP
jgi:predicted transcriptional regulator